MKTKIISLSFLFCFSFDNSYGQTNNAYVEFLGIGLMGSINYEKMIVADKIFAMASLVYFNLEEKDTFDVYNVITEQSLSITPICLGAIYMYGNKLKVEAGGGIAYWITSYEWDAQFTGIGDIGFTEGGNYLNFYSTLGLRYQNPKGGMNFKVGLSPIYLNIEGVRETIIFPHLSFGYSWQLLKKNLPKPHIRGIFSLLDR